MLLHSWCVNDFAICVNDFAIKVHQDFSVGKEEGSIRVHPAQINMSSVARDISLFPCRTLARTASMIRALGISSCGFKSGTQNWHLRPHPVVISTTPNVVRLSGKRMASREVG